MFIGSANTPVSSRRPRAAPSDCSGRNGPDAAGLRIPPTEDFGRPRVGDSIRQRAGAERPRPARPVY